MKDYKYKQIMLGDEEKTLIFVRVEDWDAFKKARKSKKFDSNKIVALSMQMMLNSPEGMNKLYKGIEAVHFIMGIKSKKQLKNLKEMIDLQIRRITKENRKPSGK